MITEDYVSFETAKLLREKGYNGPSVFYDEEDAYRWNSENSIEVSNPNYDPSIPFDTETFRECLPHITLAMTMKWLREMHKLDVDVSIEYKNSKKVYYYSVLKKTVIRDIDCLHSETNFDSYEEAAEAAIKYCLENLV